MTPENWNAILIAIAAFLGAVSYVIKRNADTASKLAEATATQATTKATTAEKVSAEALIKAEANKEAMQAVSALAEAVTEISQSIPTSIAALTAQLEKERIEARRVQEQNIMNITTLVGEIRTSNEAILGVHAKTNLQFSSTQAGIENIKANIEGVMAEFQGLKSVVLQAVKKRDTAEILAAINETQEKILAAMVPAKLKTGEVPAAPNSVPELPKASGQ